MDRFPQWRPICVQLEGSWDLQVEISTPSPAFKLDGASSAIAVRPRARLSWRSPSTASIAMSHQAKRDPVTQAELEDLLASRESTDLVPILKHKADNRVMRELKDVALRGCDAHVRALAQCAEGRLITVVWYCRAFSKAVDRCMREFADDEPLKDELRRRHGAKYPGAVKGYRESSNIEREKKEVPV